MLAAEDHEKRFLGAGFSLSARPGMPLDSPEGTASTTRRSSDLDLMTVVSRYDSSQSWSLPLQRRLVRHRRNETSDGE